MQAVLNAAVPIFALILVGFLCGRFGGFTRESTDSINRFAVYLALPALIFTTMAKITPAEIGQVGFAAGFAGGIALTFALAFWVGRRRGGSIADASIEGLDAGYSNVGFMGIPLCLLVFGPEGLPAAVIATLFTACVLFLTAIVLVEFDLRRGVDRRGTVRRVLLSLLRNPLFIAPIAGLAVGLTGLPIPAPLETAAKLLGGAASPSALVCIGLFLAQESALAGDRRTIGLLVVLKLLFQPAVTALLVYGVFDVPPLWARAAVLLSALPIGSGPFTIAKLYRLQAGVTSGAILISHLVSVLTVSALVAWLG
ncbi:AEC family transporter [Methylobacterium sp. NEAU 140]|uniref:AEC family transporter n=1 Tax=Methylobacterium sp. NEAU 140 TaxID=3064945 RepID=UPI002736C42E|nr:AEC family transporter [Methylobacterium sp. NEAU 140]MDP4025254.1 AEC family transporter [Methylobacterium sp. NEAU 140]